jgi:plastocyanin
MTGRVLAVIALLYAAAAGGADVSGSVRIGGRPAPNTVVYLEMQAEPPPAVPPRVIMDQRNLAFVPAVLPVRRGTVVEFTNSDDVQHNVFTPSEAGGTFNLGTYNRGEARSVLLDRAGEAVVLCNIHMEMEAHIVVVDGPHFAVTDEAGAFRVPGLPPGRSTLRLWHRGWLPYTRAVEVGKEPVELTVDVEP